MKNNVEETSKINARNIDVANYFMTLTNEAAAAGILSEWEIEYMETQIREILSDLIWQYNNGKSTSVTTEDGARLIKSVVTILDYFCIHTVQSAQSAQQGSLAVRLEKCVEMLRGKAGIKKCYEKGGIYYRNHQNLN
jgi:hypothetical protein